MTLTDADGGSFETDFNASNGAVIGFTFGAALSGSGSIAELSFEETLGGGSLSISDIVLVDPSGNELVVGAMDSADVPACANVDSDDLCDAVDSCLEEDGASQECGCNTGIADGACDCDGNVLDCAGDCGGTAWESDCGCVAADKSGDDCDDCLGDPNGAAVVDICGVCDGGCNVDLSLTNVSSTGATLSFTSDSDILG